MGTAGRPVRCSQKARAAAAAPPAPECDHYSAPRGPGRRSERRPPGRGSSALTARLLHARPAPAAPTVKPEPSLSAPRCAVKVGHSPASLVPFRRHSRAASRRRVPERRSEPAICRRTAERFGRMRSSSFSLMTTRSRVSAACLASRRRLAGNVVVCAVLRCHCPTDELLEAIGTPSPSADPVAARLVRMRHAHAAVEPSLGSFFGIRPAQRRRRGSRWGASRRTRMGGCVHRHSPASGAGC